jgi:hypothetical protein
VPRPRRRKRFTVSLFPFLSVLACVIGVLTLLITASALGELGGGALDLETYEKLEAEIATGRQKLRELRALEEETESLEPEAAAVREENARLRSAREGVGDKIAASAPMREELRTAEERVAVLEAEQRRLDAEREKLEASLGVQRRAAASAPLRLQPSGSGTGIEPHFAECRDDGVVLYQGPERQPRHVPTAGIETSPDVRSFLRRVRARSGASAILLVRPSGVGSCNTLRQEAGRHNARHGLMPLPEDGELDFSVVGGES